MARINYYNPIKDNLVKCDASHSAHGANLEKKLGERWMPSAFTYCYLNAQEKELCD